MSGISEPSILSSSESCKTMNNINNNNNNNNNNVFLGAFKKLNVLTVQEYK